MPILFSTISHKTNKEGKREGRRRREGRMSPLS